ncbi:unnamed protein product [Adineta steineri]|uniref:N-acetylmuramoyl-L-alanine amidase n=2 Tax=Adineta steineri TaxID=433720 RepID=A0A819TUB1_9BILA|nr:unnamed protein product [Adineta steineri]
MMLTNLADILREAGLTVIESDGWKTRGHGKMTSVKSIICHHTAGPATGDYPSLKTVRDGRKDLSGPLSQLGLGRSGKWYVIAAGLCYHAGVVTDTSLYSNANAIGIEAEGTGIPSTDSGHTHWPDVQYESYLRGVKALQKAFNVPTSHVKGHKEIAAPAGRKADPNFSMDEFRAALEGLDAVISIGTTSVFLYITELALRTAHKHAIIIEINPDDTEVSHVVRDQAITILSKLLHYLS